MDCRRRSNRNCDFLRIFMRLVSDREKVLREYKKALEERIGNARFSFKFFKLEKQFEDFFNRAKSVLPEARGDVEELRNMLRLAGVCEEAMLDLWKKIKETEENCDREDN